MGRARRYILVVFAAVSLLALLIGCVGRPPEISAGLGQEFTLAPGQTASIEGEPLKVTFLEAVNDSRCPRGVICVWQGEASCLVEIVYRNSASRMVLTQLGSGPAQADFNEYRFAFEVQPYPEAGKRIEKQDYRLKLVVSR